MIYFNVTLLVYSQVLFLVDPIDEVAIQNLKAYKEKKFVDISKEGLDLGKCMWHSLFIQFQFSTVAKSRTLGIKGSGNSLWLDISRVDHPCFCLIFSKREG